MRPNENKSSIASLSHRKSRKKISKSIGTIKPSTPLKGAEIKNFFVVRQLEMLEQHISNYSALQPILDSDKEKEIKKINLKKIQILNKFKHNDSIKDEDNTNKLEAIHEDNLNNIGRRMKNRVNLNQTLELTNSDNGVLETSKHISKRRVNLFALNNK